MAKMRSVSFLFFCSFSKDSPRLRDAITYKKKKNQTKQRTPKTPKQTKNQTWDLTFPLLLVQTMPVSSCSPSQPVYYSKQIPASKKADSKCRVKTRILFNQGHALAFYLPVTELHEVFQELFSVTFKLDFPEKLCVNFIICVSLHYLLFRGYL